MKELLYNDFLRIKKFSINILIDILITLISVYSKNIPILLLGLFALTGDLIYISVKEKNIGFTRAKIRDLKQIYSVKDIVSEKYALVYISTALLFVIDYILIHLFGRTEFISAFQVQIIIFYLFLPILLPILLNTSEVVSTVSVLLIALIDAGFFFRMEEELLRYFTSTNVLICVILSLIFASLSFLASLKILDKKEWFRWKRYFIRICWI